MASGIPGCFLTFPLQQQSKLTYRFAGRMTPTLWLSLTRSHTPTRTLPPPPSISSSLYDVHPGAAPAFPLWPTGQSDERYWTPSSTYPAYLPSPPFRPSPISSLPQARQLKLPPTSQLPSPTHFSSLCSFLSSHSVFSCPNCLHLFLVTPNNVSPSNPTLLVSKSISKMSARKRKQEEEEEELVALPSDESEEEEEYVSDEDEEDDDEDAEEDEEEYDDDGGEPEVKNGVKPHRHNTSPILSDLAAFLLTLWFVLAEAPPKKKQKTTTAPNDSVPVSVPVIDDGEEEEEEEEFDEEGVEAELGEEYDDEEGIEEEEWDDDADEPISKAKVGVDTPAGGKKSAAAVTAGGDEED
ncbi:hypothetical protein EV127DRAFT_414970 [Xylaria flabelliformis]|nr:hypothetical protein EV127DRAFT_414970 [Xylaria flabelliformis]